MEQFKTMDDLREYAKELGKFMPARLLQVSTRPYM